MIILGVDFGDSRTGLAVVNTQYPIVSPLSTIKDDYIERVAKTVAGKAIELKAQLIVIGLPLNMNGSEGERVTKTRSFGKLVFECSGIEIAYFDERLSSSYAHVVMNQTDTKGKKRKNSVDAIAATVILQNYIDKNRSNFS